MAEPTTKATLRLYKSDYEYIRQMAESKFDYGGLNLIVREVVHAFVENTKKLVAEKQATEEARSNINIAPEAAE